MEFANSTRLVEQPVSTRPMPFSTSEVTSDLGLQVHAATSDLLPLFWFFKSNWHPHFKHLITCTLLPGQIFSEKQSGSEHEHATALMEEMGWGRCRWRVRGSWRKRNVRVEDEDPREAWNPRVTHSDCTLGLLERRGLGRQCRQSHEHSHR